MDFFVEKNTVPNTKLSVMGAVLGSTAMPDSAHRAPRPPRIDHLVQRIERVGQAADLVDEAARDRLVP